MLRDWGSWCGDFRGMTAELRARLLDLLGDDKEAYDCVPVQGSGTFAIAAMRTSLISIDGKALVLADDLAITLVVAAFLQALTEAESFRVGCVGRMDADVMYTVVAAAKQALIEMNVAALLPRLRRLHRAWRRSPETK